MGSRYRVDLPSLNGLRPVSSPGRVNAGGPGDWVGRYNIIEDPEVGQLHDDDDNELWCFGIFVFFFFLILGCSFCFCWEFLGWC